MSENGQFGAVERRPFPSTAMFPRLDHASIVAKRVPIAPQVICLSKTLFVSGQWR
jgi:hypothetical protein